MDNHDRAHYGLAACLAATMAYVYHASPPGQPTWPSLSTDAAQKIVRMSGQNPLDVYCADAACGKIARALAAAGVATKIKVNVSPLLSGPNGATVGAPTQAAADVIKRAVEEGSGGALKVIDSVPGQPTVYVSFGHIAD